MRESLVGAYGAFSRPAADCERTAARLTTALAWTAVRHARENVFGSGLFQDPAWDILLALYISQSQGLTECVKTICAGSSAPTTTVCRWITLLEGHQLIERMRDPQDKRRTLLQLLPEGLSRMDEALDAAAESDAKLGLGRMRLIKDH